MIGCVASVCGWLPSFSMLVVAKVKFPMLVVAIVGCNGCVAKVGVDLDGFPMLVVVMVVLTTWWLIS